MLERKADAEEDIEDTLDLAQYVEGNVLDLHAIDSPCSKQIQRLKLTPNDIPQIMKFLHTHPEITEVNFSSNYQLGDKFAQAFSSNTTVTTLNVMFTHLSDEGTKALAQHPKLAHLDASCNAFTTAGLTPLLTNPNLKTLLCNQSDARDVPSDLLTNTKVTKLDLSPWTIDDKACNAIAANKSITSLTIGTSYVTLAGIKALMSNPRITEVDVEGSNIGDDAAAKLNDRKKEELIFLLSQAPEVMEHRSVFAKMLPTITSYIAEGMQVQNGEEVNKVLKERDDRANRALVERAQAKNQISSENLEHDREQPKKITFTLGN